MLGSNGTLHHSSDSCWGRGSSSPASADASDVREAYASCCPDAEEHRGAAKDAASSAGEPTNTEASGSANPGSANPGSANPGSESIGSGTPGSETPEGVNAGEVNPWHGLLYERLRDRALPALISDDTITPAASLWTGSRLWLESFRDAGLQRGDRLLISLSPTAAFAQVMVAALWQGVTLVMLPPDADVGTHLNKMDARAAVSDEGVRHGVVARPASTPHTWQPEGLAGPADPPETLRATNGPATPEARFLLRTSGTTGEPTWVALSDRNVLSVLASHMPHMQLQHARTLSVLPWTHAFGLVLDFLPALLSETEIIRDPNGGRDPDELLRLSRAWGATHLSAVPLVIDRIAGVDGGPGMLCSLTGGIVGGAPVSGSLAQLLSGTSLRAGYGQTEASPGIALGPPGHWSANYMGRPLGCSVDIDEHGELYFEGDNACIGIWENGTLTRLDPDRRVATGDRVSRDGDDLFFRGRTDNTFKLSNGRLVAAGHIESVVKQRFRRVDEAFVFSPDGDNVALAVRLDDQNASPPSVDAVSAAIGSVSERLIEIVAIPPEDWKNTPKGTVARDDMSAFLRRTFSTSPSSSSSASVSSS